MPPQSSSPAQIAGTGTISAGCACRRSGATALHLLQASQQETSQTPRLLDLAVHRLPDRLALDIDPGTRLAVENAGHSGLSIGTLGQWASSGRWPPATRHVAGDHLAMLLRELIDKAKPFVDSCPLEKCAADSMN